MVPDYILLSITCHVNVLEKLDKSSWKYLKYTWKFDMKYCWPPWVVAIVNFKNKEEGMSILRKTKKGKMYFLINSCILCSPILYYMWINFHPGKMWQIFYAFLERSIHVKYDISIQHKVYV